MARVWIRWTSLTVALGAWFSASPVRAQAPQPVPPPAPPPGVQPPTPVAPAAPPGEAMPGALPAQPPLAQPEPVPPPGAIQPAEPPAAPLPEVAPAPLPAEPAPLDAPFAAPVVPDEAEPAWYDTIAFNAFADAYYSLDFNFPKGRVPNPIRAYDNHDGFSLSWVGLDVEKAPEPVGGVISLRFGPTAERIGASCVDGECDDEYGLSVVKQGFVSWKPGGSESAVRLDLGKFDTPYGAEVAEAQYNFNYTRGALYWLGQPVFHTGLRMVADLDRAFSLKLLAVNGWNRTVDNNLGKTFGLQGTLRVPATDGSDSDLVTVSLGYLVGPEWDDFVEIDCPTGTTPDASEPDGCEEDPDGEGGQLLVDRGGSNTEGLRHFLDLTVTATPIPQLGMFLNGSLGIDNQRSATNLDEFDTALWWGVAAAARYALDERMGIAARGEYFNDHDGYATGFAPLEIGVVTGTLTFDYSPATPVKLFVDGRIDWSNRQIFPKQVREMSGTAVSLTVGAVVATY